MISWLSTCFYMFHLGLKSIRCTPDGPLKTGKVIIFRDGIVGVAYSQTKPCGNGKWLNWFCVESDVILTIRPSVIILVHSFPLKLSLLATQKICREGLLYRHFNVLLHDVEPFLSLSELQNKNCNLSHETTTHLQRSANVCVRACILLVGFRGKMIL